MTGSSRRVTIRRSLASALLNLAHCRSSAFLAIRQCSELQGVARPPPATALTSPRASLRRLTMSAGTSTPELDKLKIEDNAAPSAAPAAPAAAAQAEVPHPSGLSLEERFQLCRSVAEECISDDELRNLLRHKPHPVRTAARPGLPARLSCAVLPVFTFSLSLALFPPCRSPTMALSPQDACTSPRA